MTSQLRPNTATRSLHPVVTSITRADQCLYLESVQAFPGTGRTAMVNKIHLEVAGLRFVPGDAPHGNVAGQPIASLWPRPGETRFILMSVWGVGGTVVIFLAGLQGVPRSLYEAAEIDGANTLQRFRHVTIPMMTPVIFFNMLVGIIGSFQVFTAAYVMTGGGPQYSTLFYVLYLFRQGFKLLRMGYAAAMAWILFIIIVVLTLIQLRLSTKWVYYEGELVEE